MKVKNKTKNNLWGAAGYRSFLIYKNKKRDMRVHISVQIMTSYDLLKL